MSFSQLKFERKIKVSFGNSSYTVEDLKVVFRVERFASARHTMELEIYNMGEIKSSENLLEIGNAITLEAGYKDFKDILFVGRIGNTNGFRKDLDYVTTFYCHDGMEFSKKLLSFSWVNSTNLNSILNDMARMVGTRIVFNNIEPANIKGSYLVSSSFENEMNILSNSFNFKWYFINGELYLYDSARGNTEKALFEISALNGLLETPRLTNRGIDLKMLLEPSIQNEDIFTVNSKGVEITQSRLEYSKKNSFGLGVQRVFSIVHTGDTHGDEWYTELIGIKI